MPEAAITVDFEELEGSPTEGFNSVGFEATRVLKCAWADRLVLASQLKGGTFVTGGSAVYFKPYAYSAFTAARVDSVGVVPFDDNHPVAAGVGSGTQTASYSFAKLTVLYKTGKDPDKDDDSTAKLIEESIEPFAEFLTLPADGFFWDDPDGEPLTAEEAPGKLYKGINWVYARSGIVGLPAAMFDLIGKVNSGSLHSKTLNRDFDAETLLYNPPILRRQTTADGNGAWTVEYRFSYKPQTWQKFWRNATKTWSRIFTANGPADPYETGDFTQLI